MADTHRTSDCPARDILRCYLCGSTDHSKKDCLKFVPLKRAQGRGYSVEIQTNELIPISDNEDEEQIEDESPTNTLRDKKNHRGTPFHLYNPRKP